MKDVLGGKGAGLAEMTNAGLPVPPGFTIVTSACRLYFQNGNISTLDPKRMRRWQLERLQGQNLGEARIRCWCRSVPAPSFPCPA